MSSGNLYLQLLNIKLLKLKSFAFLNIVLFSEEDSFISVQDTSSPQSEQIVSNQTDVLDISLVRQPCNIKQNSWKAISQALQSEQDDSKEKLNYSISSSHSPVRLPQSLIIQKQIKKMPHYSQVHRCRDDMAHLAIDKTVQQTNDTSRVNRRAIKLKKRAIIMKKLENIEMCMGLIICRSHLPTLLY